jgi:2,3-bisphosphoglycerate-dependent phosphoglycerate mutase/probable phosphoglycerate mutase
VTLSRLILLRHGQTDFNVAGRMQGHLESVLTPIGRAQAVAAAPVVAALAPDRLISSDLSRAADTAELVGAVCGLPVKLDARLRETHLGQWQGMSVDEIEAEYPGAIATWRSDAAWAPPGGESRIQVVERSRPVVHEVDAEPSDGGSEALLVVAHGGLIAGLVSGLLDLPARAWPAIGGLGNCRWAVLARRPDHPRWRLAGYNVGA